MERHRPHIFRTLNVRVLKISLCLHSYGSFLFYIQYLPPNISCIENFFNHIVYTLLTCIACDKDVSIYDK